MLSAVLGYALPNLLSRNVTHYLACALFALFGGKLLYEIATGQGEDSVDDEIEEVENELLKKDMSDDSSDLGKTPGDSLHSKTDSVGGFDLESGLSVKSQKLNWISKMKLLFFSPIFLQCFTMTFLAEWGDRSQISTIALAAAKNPFGVTLGMS